MKRRGNSSADTMIWMFSPRAWQQQSMADFLLVGNFKKGGNKMCQWNTKARYSLPSQCGISFLIFLASVNPKWLAESRRQMTVTNDPIVINIKWLHHCRFIPFLPYSFFSHSKNACLTCPKSAVNNSVLPKVNFQFAQWRVTITFWPANSISPLIPHHFISFHFRVPL